MTRPCAPRRPLAVQRAAFLAAWLAVAAACSGSTSPDSGALRVTVEPPEVEVATGSSVPLRAVVRNGNGEVVANPQLFWASGDTSVAAITPAGVLSGRRVGVTRVVASVLGSDADVIVRVVAPAVAAVAVAPAAATVAVGATQQLTATVKDAAGADRTDRPVAWTSDNEAVASVTAFTGVITGRSAGTATVTATVDGKTATAAVTVTGVQTPPPGPTAAFTVGCTDLVCAFTDLSTGGDGSVESFAWTFGDNNISPYRNSDHPYGSAGSYAVRLMITNSKGATSTATRTIVVSAPGAGSLSNIQLVHRLSGRCLSVEGRSADRGARLVTRACDGGVDQNVALPVGDGVGPVQLSGLGDRYLQLSALQSDVETAPWIGAQVQRWTVTGTGQLRNFVTNTCLAADRDAGRTIMAVCNADPAQQWEVRR